MIFQAIFQSGIWFRLRFGGKCIRIMQADLASLKKFIVAKCVINASNPLNLKDKWKLENVKNILIDSVNTVVLTIIQNVNGKGFARINAERIIIGKHIRS